jgi:malate dehydrogenase (oxaloacetate-decarboxylating)
VGTGRGDFPNQVNNSLGFPGILKGALLVRARKVTDSMATAAAKSLAAFAEKRGINPDNVIATMEEPAVFPNEAADVATQAVKDGVARVQMSRDEAYRKAEEDISYARKLTEFLIRESFIKTIPQEILDLALNSSIEEASRS